MRRTEAIERLKQFEPRLRAMGANALYLFGSTARGDERSSSDVDVFLDVEPGRRFTLFDLAAAQRLLSDGLGENADLTTRDGLHPGLKDEILVDAIKIF